MSKAFTKESDGGEDEASLRPLAPNVKNYMTPTGFAALQQELRRLMREERPKVVETVAWAASNGDRSENGDYIYGKKRLREIDRRARYLTKRLESAEIVDPDRQQGLEQVFFGATVRYEHANGVQQTVTLVGIDEANLSEGKISWISPVAKALMKARAGDSVELHTPGGPETVEVLSIQFVIPRQ